MMTFFPCQKRHKREAFFSNLPPSTRTYFLLYIVRESCQMNIREDGRPIISAIHLILEEGKAQIIIIGDDVSVVINGSIQGYPRP